MSDREQRATDELLPLLSQARSNPHLMAAMVADIDEVIRERNLSIDTNDGAYAELSLRLYHLRTLTNRTFDEMHARFTSFGDRDFAQNSPGMYMQYTGFENPAITEIEKGLGRDKQVPLVRPGIKQPLVNPVKPVNVPKK